MKIDNSKESAIMSGTWSKPGASFYNNLMSEDNYQSLINEAFLISDDVDKDTTFAQSGCKYPHHVIKDDTLVVSAPGIKAAYSRARQMGVYKGDVKEHLDKHMRELGYLDKKGIHYEEIMEENFQYIESVIDSALGTNLVMMESELQEYDEKSHGTLKYDFRRAYDVKTGHLVKIVFSLEGINVEDIGHGATRISTGDAEIDSEEFKTANKKNVEFVQKNIAKLGNTDHRSSNQKVVAIVDLVTNQRLSSVEAVGQYAPFMVPKLAEQDEEKIKYYANKKLEDLDWYNSVVTKYEVGKVVPKSLFKSTFFPRKPVQDREVKYREPIGTIIQKVTDTRGIGQSSEALLHGRGAKLHDIDREWATHKIGVGDTLPKYKHPSKKDIKKSPDLYKHESVDESDEYIEESVFDEASHGSLKHSFRLCANVENGHMIKVTFDLDPNSIVMAGDHTNQGGKAFDKLEYLKQHITKTGSGDFSSIGTVQGITDLDTGKPLTTVRTCGIIGSDPNSVRFTVPSEYMNQTKDGVFSTLPVAIREKIAASSNVKNSPKGITTFTVGQKETTPSYKSTRALSNTAALFNNQFSAIKGFHNPDKMELRHNPYAKGNLDIKNNSNYIKFSNMSMDKFMQWATPRIAKLDTYIQTNEKNIPRSKLWTMDDAVESFDRLKRRYEKNKNEKFNQVVSNPSYSDMAATVINGISKMTESTYVEEDNIEELEEWMDTVITEGWDAVEEFDEKSHGRLKFDFRLGWDAKTGNQIKIVYSLQDINVTDVGDFYYNYAGKKDGATHDSHLDYTRKNIARKGNTDHQSTGQKVLAIIDMVTKKRLPEVDLLNPFCRYVDTHAMTQPAENLKAANDYARSNPDSKTYIKVGEIDNSKTFKSTAWAKGNTTDQNGEDFRFQQIASSEELKHGRGWDIHNIIPKRFRLAGQDDGGFVFKQNPTKEEAIEELQVRYEDNKRMINYMSRQIANGNNDPRAKEYVEWLKKNNEIIQKDYSTIKSGSYDVSMMKKYREATEYSESYINSLMDSMLPAHQIEEKTDDDFRESTSDDNDIIDKWFIKSDDGVDNCCISVRGYDKPMRGRSAMITLQLQEDDNWYLLCKKNADDYGVPGGGWNKNESPEQAAIRELQEETLSNVKNVKRMGTLIEYSDTVKDWVKEHVPNKDDWWYGYYSAIFVGIYDGKYTGKVKDQDRESGYEWKKVDHNLMKNLPKEYADAINEYINKENPFQESVFEESKLQYDFRYGYDNKTGHMLKIVYELDNIKVDYAGHAYNPEDLKAQKLSINPSANKEVKNTIASAGNLDHRSHGQKVIKIVDMVTGENLNSANVLSFFAGGNVGNIGKKELTREEIKLRKSSGKVKIDHIKVGEIDRHRSFKSTYLFKGTNAIQKSMDAQASMKTARGAKPQTISTNYMKGPIQIPVYNNPSKDDMDNILKALCENMLQGAIETYEDDAPESFMMFINAWNSGAYSNLPEWKVTGGHKITVKILDSIMKDLMTAGKATELDTIRQVKSLFIKNHNESSDLLCGITIGRDIITDIKYMKELFNLNPDIFNHNVRTMNNIGISKDTIAQINEMYCESLILDDDTYIFCIEYPDVHNEYGSLIRIPECVDNLKKLIDNGALSEKTDMRISEYFTGFVDNNSLFSKWYKQHQMGNNCQTSDFIFDARDSMLIESTMDESVFTEAEEDEKPEEEKDILDEPIEDDTNQQDPPPVEEPTEPQEPTSNEEQPAEEDLPKEDNDIPEQPEEPPQEPQQQPVPQKTPISRPKQFANQEQDKNGVRRKNLYIEFIRWAKEYNPKNIFGSNFDKDIFTGSYPFVPDEMRYFYRLADPTLCILAGGLTFFPVIQLRKLNAENKHLDQYMIFAATDTDMRVFSNVDKRVYMATEQNGEIVLGKALANTFDTYIQIMIDKGDILNGPREDTTLEYVEDME